MSKRIPKGAFLGIWLPIAAVTAGAAIALEVSATAFKGPIDYALGKGEMHVAKVEGSESWNTDYYSQSFDQSTAAGGNAKAKENGEAVVEKITNEGMVLLKNLDNALPIASTSEVTLLGRGSVDPVYGGSGSGNVDVTTCANPKSGLEDAGLTVDSGAYNFFRENYVAYPRQNIVMDNYEGSTFFIGEIPADTYAFPVKSDNTAVVFISRCGGEGLDLSTNLKRDSQTTESQRVLGVSATAAAEVSHYTDDQHELELSAEEKGMLEFAKANYNKVVVVLNESTTMEIGDLKDDEGIDAIIWAGSPGSTGFNSLGNILTGDVNPSGKTPDLYVRDFTADPTFQNFAINGVNEYTGVDEANIDTGNEGITKAKFVQYEEGIYLGYRYYETRGAKEGEAWYNNNVVYPFGYGLSYTTFDKEIVSRSIGGNTISLDVKVTNTGSVAGKEVVQLYYTAPYTEGGIEKASTVLGDFAKTEKLAPGASQTLTLEIAIDEMSSYDYKTEKAYVLDAGDYVLEIKDDSHTVSTHEGAAQTYTYNNPSRRVIKQRESDKAEVTNRFDDVSAMFKDAVTEGYATNFSRKDFAGTFPTKATAADADASRVIYGNASIADGFKKFDQNNAPFIDKAATAPKVGQTNGLTLSSLRGFDYEDESYELLLDQLTDADYEGMADYIVNNAYIVNAIESVGIPGSDLHDGPQGWSSLMGGLANVCAYMSEPLLAATFNVELAKEMGTAVGEEALAMNPLYAGWYGPAMNTHRSPFAGRNFEYYSEDGLLGGKIAAAVVSGAADKGVITFIKHFALNDQETWRTAHLATWANEQAMREIYLKPFEIAVKNAKTTVKYLDQTGQMQEKVMGAATGVMSSFNYVGTTWAGGRRDLMHDVLRTEWGFRGVGSSDFNLYNYMDPLQGCYAGTDLQLTWKAFKDRTFLNTKDAGYRLVYREAIHNLAYALANSNAMQGVAPGARVWYDMSPWRIGFYIAEGVLAAVAVTGLVLVIIRLTRKDEEAIG